MRWLSLLLTFQYALWIDVPFIRQDKSGCGSASIWMVMKYWRPDTVLDVDQIQRRLYSEQAGGIYAKDMARYFESHGYRTFAFRGDWADLEEHIAKGRPLIVCLERNKRGVPLHYVVVAGVDSAASLVLINDPAQRKLLSMSRSEFEQSWQATDNWTLLALPELDLASSAFRQNKLAETSEHLNSALRLNPADAFTNDFLATVYFLQDNTEAALKHWNRAGKPHIENIRFDPPLATDPVILDRAFAFSRGGVLYLRDYETTQARLSALRVFSRYRMDLSPAATDSFDLTLRAAERNGASLWSWARGLPFQSVHPEFSNIDGKATNVGSMLRWDPNKRRAFVFFEAPLGGNPAWSWRASTDGRDELWTSDRGGFRMKKLSVNAELRAVPSGRWSWTSGVELSSRRFSNDFGDGIQLKYSGSVSRTLVREPSRRLLLNSAVKFDTGKLWMAAPSRFTRLMSTTSLDWGSFTTLIRMGRALGQIPFDERFIIGLDRDSELWMRAHSATVDGRKNASNAGSSFILANSDFQKAVVDSTWFRLSAGPFLDTGKSSLSPRWLADTGVELRFSILGSFGLSLSYGRSLSDSQDALFLRHSGL